MAAATVLTLQSPVHRDPCIGGVYQAMVERLLSAEACIRVGRFSAAVRHLADVRADYTALRPIIAAYAPGDEIGRRLRSLSRAIEHAPANVAPPHEAISSSSRARDARQRRPLHP